MNAEAPTASKPARKPRAPKKAAPKAPRPAREKKLSALDAAANVLARCDNPKTADELVAMMAEQGLWKSPGGKTPAATLYAAIVREIASKGKESRFKKASPGHFLASGAAA